MSTTHPVLQRIWQCALAFFLLTPFFRTAVSVSAAQPTDFAAIDSYIEGRMRELRIPGLALGIVQGDQIVHLKGFGVADSDGQQVTPQTPFQINSLGKPMTAVAIMQLVEAGKLDLDAPVQRYLPWFRVADAAASAQITPRHLLYHTSGLPGMAGMEQTFSEDARPDAIEQRVPGLRSAQLNRPVGASYEYANAGYITLGLLVQTISGQPYEAYMGAHLYGPLAMRQTFTDWTEARSHGAASGHRYWFGAPLAGDLPVNRGNLPAGAHTSASAEDVTHFLIAQLNGGRFTTTAMLSPAGIAEMQRPVPRSADGADFHAMGWDSISAIGNVTTMVKSGAGGDFFGQMLLLPERRLGLVVLMNANKGLGSPLSDERLMMLSFNVAELLLGDSPTVFPAAPTPTLLYATLFLAVIAQATGMARTAILLRRWRAQAEQHPRGAGVITLRIALPLLLNLGWGLFALLSVPLFFGAPLWQLVSVAPDFGSTLVPSGVVALIWACIRTALVWRALRTSQPALPLMVSSPVKG